MSTLTLASMVLVFAIWFANAATNAFGAWRRRSDEMIGEFMWAVMSFVVLVYFIVALYARAVRYLAIELQ